jgi:PAS domain S-box-containing protein
MKGRLERLLPVVERELRETESRRDREKAEQALRENENRYRDLVEASHALICTHDLTGRILRANHASAELLGISKAQLEGSNLKSFLDPKFRDEFDEYLLRIKKNGADSGLMTVITATGKRRIWRYHNSLRTEGVPEPIVRGVALDVTETHGTERALRASEERYRSLFENNPFPMIVFDTRTLRFEEVNAAAIDHYGYSREEFLAMTIRDIRPQEDLPTLDAILCGPRAEVRNVRLVRHRKKDGSLIDVEVTAIEIGTPGGPHRLAILNDITERKRAEEDLRTSQEQLRALSAHLQIVREEERTGLARELHDELGQALTALKMDLALIQGRVLSDDVDTRKAALEKIATASEVADGMIQTIRRISSELRPGMLDDLGLLPSIEWLAQDFSQRTGIACRLLSEIDSLAPDRARSTAVFRILQETLTNVARHSGATEVSVRLGEAGGALGLEVHDNGKGFRPAVLNDSSSLGLIGMRERAGSVGGSIEFVSGPGEGVTMRLRVPLSESGEP